MPMVGIATRSVSSRARRSFDPLDHQRKRAGLGDGDPVGDNLAAFLLVVAARAVAAERVDRLRGEADMAHHRDAAPGEERDRLGHLLAAFELYRQAAGLGHDPGGGAERVRWRRLIRPKRQIHDNRRVARRPHHRSAMRDHHVEGHGQRAVEAVDHHRQAVADQEQVDLRVEQPRHRGGIGRKTHQLVAAFAAFDLADREALGPGLDAHTALMTMPINNADGQELPIRRRGTICGAKIMGVSGKLPRD